MNVYLFSLLSELEVRLGEFVHDQCTEEELFEMTLAGDSLKHADVRKQYESDKTNGVDLPLIEYLFLSDLITIIGKKTLFGKLGYPSRGKFQDDLGPLNDLRTSVAHPVRSLVSDLAACQRLWERIDRIEGVIFHLHTMQRRLGA